MRRPRVAIGFAVVGLVALCVLAGVQLWAGRPVGFASTRGHGPHGPADLLVRQRLVIGHSVRGRAITAVALGDPDASRKLLVVGCIHGDESAGTAIARRLEAGVAPKQALLWVVGDLNPDGVAAGTRQNADGVDLNRNSPWHWRRLGHRGDQQYSGPRPLSEPESRIAHALILRVRPQVTIWFHQPLGVVDESGGNVRVERRYARLTGLPLRRLTRYPGSAAGWQNHRLPGSTAFVVELPARLSKKAARRDSNAVRRLAV
jgi:murein peptide amidase A